MTCPDANRKPLATSVVLGLLVAALAVVAPTAGSATAGQLVRPGIAVHAAVPLSQAELVSPAPAPSPPHATTPVALPAPALVLLAPLLLLIRGDLRTRPASAQLVPRRRNRAPPRPR